MNNPLKYTDPTGHYYCGDQYDPACFDNQQEKEDYAEMAGDDTILRWIPSHNQNEPIDFCPLVETEYRDGSPGRDMSRSSETVATLLNVIGATIDTVQFVVSIVGTEVQIAAFAGGGPGGAIVAYLPFDAFDEIMGEVGTFGTLTADYFGGYTYFEVESSKLWLVIGQDSVVNIAANFVVDETPISVIDLAANGYEALYSWQHISAVDPTFELRVNLLGEVRLTHYYE